MMRIPSLVTGAACVALAATTAQSQQPVEHAPVTAMPAWPERAVRRDLPLQPGIRRAYAAGTRDTTGAPGPRY